jgi:peptide/nickel transport system substrate-binding protein
LVSVHQYGAIASFIVRELEQMGIQVALSLVPRHVLLQQTSKSEVSFFRGSWIADYPDAENYLSVFYGKNPAPPNYTRYNNMYYNRFYETAVRTFNDSIRYMLYQKMDSCLMSDAVVIPLWYDEVLHLVNSDIQGFNPNPLNMMDLRRVKK